MLFFLLKCSHRAEGIALAKIRTEFTLEYTELSLSDRGVEPQHEFLANEPHGIESSVEASDFFDCCVWIGMNRIEPAIFGRNQPTPREWQHAALFPTLPIVTAFVLKEYDRDEVRLAGLDECECSHSRWNSNGGPMT